MNSMLAEEIGLHLGDGSMNYYKNKGLYQLRGHINDDKKHYLLRITTIYKKLFNLTLNLREMPSCGVYGFQIWSDELVHYKSKILKLPLGKKIDFLIPSQIINNEELYKHFLRGYFDTDGCLYIENKKGKPYPRIEFSTISPKFTEQLKKILKTLKFKFSLYKEKRKKYGWSDIYRFRINGYKQTEKWFSEIKPANPKHRNKFKELKYGPTEI
jgi:intein/homing endonuclease